MRVDTEALLSESGWVRALARSLVADAQRAEDLAQDTWVAALQGRRAEGVPLRRWLAAVMRNLSRQDRRGELRRTDREGRAAASTEVDASEPTPDVLARLEGHRAVVEAVLGLCEPYRSAIVLRYFDGLAPRAIALRQGVPVRTVHTQLARALALLRARLERNPGSQAGGWLPMLGLLIGAERPGSLVGTVLGTLLMDMKLKVVIGAVALVGLIAVTRPLWTVEPAAAGPAELAQTPNRLAEPAVGEDPAPPIDAAPSSARAAVAVAPAPQVTAQPAVGGILRVRAIDTEGQPVAGLAARCGGALEPGAEEFRSDAGGLLELPCGDPDAVLQITDERWILVRMPFQWSRLAGAVNEVLVAQRVILDGLVVDTAGAPLAGATARVFLPLFTHSGLPDLEQEGRTRTWTTESDASGAFHLEAGVLPGGMLVVRQPGFQTDLRAQPTQTTNDLRIELTTQEADARHLRGLVVDERGYPVEGARVGLGFQHARTDAAGRFLIGLEGPDGHGVLTALKPGMLPARLERAAESNKSPGAWPDPLMLQLGGPPLSIAGRVLDAAGEAVASAKVILLDATHFGSVDWGDVEGITMRGFVEPLLAGQVDRLEVHSDAQGAFRIEGLLPRAYRLAAIDEAHLVFVESVPIEAGATGAVLRLPARATRPRLAGRILGLSGDPIAGVLVMLMGGHSDITPPADGEPFREPLQGASCETDVEGRFAFSDAPVAATHVQVHGLEIAFGTRFELAEATDLEDLEIRVARSCKLEVDLTDSALEADRLELLDAHGSVLQLTMTLGDMFFASADASLMERRSGVLGVSEEARTLVLYSGHGEVQRLPVSLKPGKSTLIRP